MLTIILLLTNILALEAAVIKAPSEPKIGAKKLLLLLILLLMLQLLLLLRLQLLFFLFSPVAAADTTEKTLQTKQRYKRDSAISALEETLLCSVVIAFLEGYCFAFRSNADHHPGIRSTCNASTQHPAAVVVATVAVADAFRMGGGTTKAIRPYKAL